MPRMLLIWQEIARNTEVEKFAFPAAYDVSVSLTLFHVWQTCFRLCFLLLKVIVNWKFNRFFFSFAVVEENNHTVMLVLFISGNHANNFIFKIWKVYQVGFLLEILIWKWDSHTERKKKQRAWGNIALICMSERMGQFLHESRF